MNALAPIARTVRSDYINMFIDIALGLNVRPDYVDRLLQTESLETTEILSHAQPAHIQLSVDKAFPITLNSQVPGRVFELSGQSDRNKTTSLIYFATLLGLDWDKAQPFLDSDNKVYRTATQVVLPHLKNGEHAELRLLANTYELTITSSEGRIAITLTDQDGAQIDAFEEQTYSIESQEDWLRYRRVLARICDIQFVGKSRDFIGQVTLEEINDLRSLCVEIITRTGLLRQIIENTTPEVSQDDILRQQSNLRQRIEEMQAVQVSIEEEVTNARHQVKQGQILITVLRELEEDTNSLVAELIRCLQRRDTAYEQEHLLEIEQRQLEGAENGLTAAQQQLYLKQPPYQEIQHALNNLRTKIDAVVTSLTVLTSEAIHIPRALTSRDYDTVLTFCKTSQIVPEAITCLEELITQAAKHSLSIMLPLEIQGQKPISLRTLVQSLSLAREYALDVQRLAPELELAFQALERAHIQSGSNFIQLESEVTHLQESIRDKEFERDRHGEAIATGKKFLQALLGSEDTSELQTKVGELTTQVSPTIRQKMQQVESLAQELSIPHPWETALSDIQNIIALHQNNIIELQAQQNNKAKEISRSQTSLRELDKARQSVGPSQFQFVYDFQHTVEIINGFLEQFYLRRERTGPTLDKEWDDVYSSYQNRLGDHLAMLRATINRVICQRCPVMYKNRPEGVQKLSVKDYDFISGLQDIPDLQDGEWAGGGGDSAMTVYGLATRATGSYLGTILLVDEFNDAETFKDVVCTDVAQLAHLGLAVFVKQDPTEALPKFKVLKP